MSRVVLALTIMGAIGWAGCTFKEEPQECSANSDCRRSDTNSPAVCRNGYCAFPNGTTPTAGNSGKSGSGTAGSGNGSGGTTTAGKSGAGTGPKAGTAGPPLPTSGAGAGAAGQTAGTGGAGTGPLAGQSGGGTQSECTAGSGEQSCAVAPENVERLGGCGSGVRTCEGGRWTECRPLAKKSAEVCDGADNDCDGKTDEPEEVETACYPATEMGCTARAMGGGFECSGRCKAGKHHCVNGVQSVECFDYVKPLDRDLCDNPTAVDDDCDGTPDDGCTCRANEARECYSGPEGTQGKGQCKSATQTCTPAGTFSACMDVVPAPETCANTGQDNDCNGKMDDILNLGVPCVIAGKFGKCATGTWQCLPGGSPELHCVGPVASPELCNHEDDDCDNKTDEITATDPDNCGMCLMVCTSRMCSSGKCVAVMPGDDAGT